MRRLMREGLIREDADHWTRMDAEVLLSIASEETERLNAIVSDLLEFARPSAMRTTATSLAMIVRDVANGLHHLREPTGKVEVRLDLCSDMSAIEIDARLVRQALLNLLLNAVQAMPMGGTIVLSTHVERRGNASFACVNVIDIEPTRVMLPAPIGVNGLALNAGPVVR